MTTPGRRPIHTVFGGLSPDVLPWLRGGLTGLQHHAFAGEESERPRYSRGLSDAAERLNCSGFRVPLRLPCCLAHESPSAMRCSMSSDTPPTTARSSVGVGTENSAALAILEVGVATKSSNSLSNPAASA